MYNPVVVLGDTAGGGLVLKRNVSLTTTRSIELYINNLQSIERNMAKQYTMAVSYT